MRPILKSAKADVRLGRPTSSRWKQHAKGVRRAVHWQCHAFELKPIAQRGFVGGQLGGDRHCGEVGPVRAISGVEAGYTRVAAGEKLLPPAQLPAAICNEGSGGHKAKRLPGKLLPEATVLLLRWGSKREAGFGVSEKLAIAFMQGPSAGKGLPRKARKPASLPKSDGDAGVQAYMAQ